MIPQFLHFIEHAPTAWHAIAAARTELLAHQFIELKEEEPWKLSPGKRYFTTRNGSSLSAFILPTSAPTELRLAASHTDSPGFKLKPKAEFSKENMVLLGVEVYGSPLLSSWLNRDLAIAGRVVLLNASGETRECLVHLKEHPVTIPQLAIHLDRKANDEGFVLNKQDHLVALAALIDQKGEGSLLESYLKESLSFHALLAHDLFLVPMENPRFLGAHKEMIAAYRIDNLASAYASLAALLEQKRATDHQIQMILLSDSEEVGSNTAQGAGSPFFMDLVERICLSLNLSREHNLRLLRRSLCASVDQGHAYHPSYADKYEPRHLALLNKGIIIKSNAQSRYASDAHSSAEIVRLCQQQKIPYQHVVSRGDIPCGSTIGPILAEKSGIATVDLGIPQLSMHSCRELIGTEDLGHLTRLLAAFLQGA